MSSIINLIGRSPQNIENIKIKTFDPHYQTQTDDYLSVYQSIFSVWQREKEEVVIERHKAGKYFSKLLYVEEQFVGFYTVNPVPELCYTCLTFLGVLSEYRRKGYGSLLMEDVKHNYKNGYSNIRYLVIEADDSQLKFYQSKGIRRLDIKYKIPKYTDDKELVEFNLLIYGDSVEGVIAYSEIEPIISHMMTYGYAITEEDPRMKMCLEENKDYISVS